MSVIEIERVTMETGIKPKSIVEIKRLASKYNIGRRLLFVSGPRGNFKRTEDIALAVSGGDITRFAPDCR